MIFRYLNVKLRPINPTNFCAGPKWLALAGHRYTSFETVAADKSEVRVAARRWLVDQILRPYRLNVVTIGVHFAERTIGNFPGAVTSYLRAEWPPTS